MSAIERQSFDRRLRIDECVANLNRLRGSCRGLLAVCIFVDPIRQRERREECTRYVDSEPADSQKRSVALLIALGTVKDSNGEAIEIGPLDVMPPGGTYAPVPERYGAAEVVSRWWGVCWPEDFDG